MKPAFSPGQALIFDLDGTLADSMSVWDTVGHNWLLGLGIQPEPSLAAILAPLSFTEAAHYCIDRYQLGISVEAAIFSWQKIVLEQYRSKVSLKPGCRAFLEKMHRCGHPMAIATSCLRVACEAFLVAQKIAPFFNAVCYTDEVGCNKANPAVYLACATLIQAAPGHCTVFEDSVFAVAGIRAAGMQLVAVHDAYNPHWEKLRQAADFSILTFEELL